jgi:hypothetical protein
MSEPTVWRRWRRKVHDILEVGGDAHPAGYVVNGFIVILIILNAIAFAAETVDHLAQRYESPRAAGRQAERKGLRGWNACGPKPRRVWPWRCASSRRPY